MADQKPDIHAIFNDALELALAEERAKFLDQACRDAPDIRERVEALLRAHSDPQNALGLAAPVIAVTVDPPITERPGIQIGPYKLIEEIGEGGMGVVYMAAQKEPVRRKVALKIIKPGMDSREVIARFAAEEQALALMDHPNIAKVLDAGSTESGRPYFVMELISGVPLTEYCDANNLTTPQRLELFVLLCLAVQHAHQKGIIHRDIKPSNILVTMHDGVPVPKIIDFGIAKAINQQLTANTVYTSHGQMIGTPLYMSPEQAEHSGLDIDTRSDIYSLGVLLYELLTGSTPFDRADLKDAGYDEVRRLIREQEPPRPSSRVSTLGKAATTASERRRTSPVELSNSLRHELDWIVMKALEKDRTRRYQTANDFARDIQRYLQDEPVEACPPSALYRLQKLTRRHRTGALATTAVALALILGAGVAAGQAYRATKAEKLAEEQLQIANEQKRLAKEQAELAQKQKRLAEDAAERELTLRVEAEHAKEKAEHARRQSDTVTDYLVEIFRSPDPERDGRLVTVVEVLNRLKDELNQNRVGDLSLQAKLLSTIGRTYQGMGLFPDAVTMLERAYKIRQETLGSDHPDTLCTLPDLVDAYHGAAGWLPSEQARLVGDDGLVRARRILGPEHPKTVELMANLVESHMWDESREDAVRYSEDALQLARRVLGPAHRKTLTVMSNLSYFYQLHYGDLDKAVKMREECLRLSRTSLGPEHPETLFRMITVERGYITIGRYAEALRLCEETLRLCRRVLGPEHPHTMVAQSDLAGCYREMGQLTKALELFEDARQAFMKSPNSRFRDLIAAKVNAANVHRIMGSFDRAMSLLNDMPAPDLLVLAETQLDMGRNHEAVDLFERAIPEIHGYDPDSEDFGAPVDVPLAYARVGRVAEAVRFARETLQRTREALGEEHPDAALWMARLGTVLCAAGQPEEAVTLLERAVRILKTQLGPESYHTLNAMHQLALAYHDVGQGEDAMRLFSDVLVLQKAALGPEHPRTLATMVLLGRGHIERTQGEDAEPLLLAAHEGYSKRNAAFPTPYDHEQAREACAQLVQLYEQSNQPDKATAWKEKLAALTEEPKKDEGSE